MSWSHGLNASTSNGKDNGANNCLSRKFHFGQRHGTTAQFAKNIDGASLRRKNKFVALNGHGAPGSIETGCGQNLCFDTEKRIESSNFKVWNAYLGRFKSRPIKGMYIYSCYTGAGRRGSKLLSLIAKSTGLYVVARTGLLFCDSTYITYEPGSTWQAAYPDRPAPDPIDLPKSKQLIHMSTSEKIHLPQIEGQLLNSADLSVSSVSISHFDDKPRTDFLEQKDSKALASLILNETMQHMPGKIMGYVTSEVEINVTGKSEELNLNIQIYNGRVAAIEEFNVMYYLPDSEQLRELLIYKDFGELVIKQD